MAESRNLRAFALVGGIIAVLKAGYHLHLSRDVIQIADPNHAHGDPATGHYVMFSEGLVHVKRGKRPWTVALEEALRLIEPRMRANRAAQAAVAKALTASTCETL